MPSVFRRRGRRFCASCILMQRAGDVLQCLGEQVDDRLREVHRRSRRCRRHLLREAFASGQPELKRKWMFWAYGGAPTFLIGLLVGAYYRSVAVVTICGIWLSLNIALIVWDRRT